MFYSHEILTSREGGIATVWLVATLGSKTNNKKVNRKSILEVDVKKTCDIISQPEAPMALRLQGNLLYGVVRVYSRQFDYVLSDAESIQANIRALLKAVKTSELDPTAGKARPDQLMIQDDPSFLPDLALPGLDIDLSALDITTDESSRLSSILDPHSQRSTSTSSGNEADPSVIPLIIPSSGRGGSGGLGGFDVPSIGPTGSGQGSAGFGGNVDDNEDFNIDLGFGFDQDGNMFEEEPTRNEGAANQLGLFRIGEDLSLGRDMRMTPAGRVQDRSIEPGFFDAANFNDDELLPDAEPFPAMAGTAPHAASSNRSSLKSKERGTESSYGAPLQRKKRAPRQLPVDDEQTTLRSAQLEGMKANYLANMAEAVSSQANRKAATIAKKNAQYLMDMGIGGVGAMIGAQTFKSPLNVFSGPAFLDKLRGIPSTVPHKRTREDANDDDDAYDADNEGRNVRSGFDEDNILQDDDGVLGLAEEGIEVGRHAEPPLEDPSMPWNISASSRQGSVVRGRGIQSSIPGFPSSAGGRSGSIGGGAGLPPSSIDRRASRITSASPLGHRGQPRQSSLGLPAHEDTNVLYSDDRNITDPQALADFEFYGPGAGVATQTVADSQWVRAALMQEASNFIAFVKTEIDARQPLPLEGEEGTIRDEDNCSVLFEELLPPAQHSKTVGAQGFYHLLALATGGRLNVTQENEDETGGFGPIRVELLVAL